MKQESFTDFLSALFETTNEKITALISGVAIVSPAFDLTNSSETARLWLPILGCIWLTSQIIIKWWSHFRRDE